MFTLNRSGAVWSVVLMGAVMSAACGESKSSMNPVAPSAVVIGAQAQEADGADGGESSTTGGQRNNNGNGNGNNGNGNGNSGNGGSGNGNNGNGNGNGNGGSGNNQPSVPGTSQPPTNTTPSTARKVEIEGVIASKNGSSITVNAQQVTVPATCVIRHGNTQFTFSDLKVGDRVHVKGTRTTTGSGATATTAIEATEVKLQNPGSGEGEDDEDEEDPTDLVSVTATDELASEAAGNTGTFRLSRAGAATLLASSLTVSFTLTGTATNGTDYTSVPLTATFPANQTTVDVVVAPTTDTTTEGAETVILTLTGVAPYDLGSPASATVTITDTDSPLVTVTAFDAAASEAGGDLGTFRFARTGSTAAGLTVTFNVSGTATAGTDYQALPATVTIPAGASTVDVFVIALPDGTTEGSESVTVTVTDGAAYDVGGAASATVNIAG